jgi:hypothetical protein
MPLSFAHRCLVVHCACLYLHRYADFCSVRDAVRSFLLRTFADFVVSYRASYYGGVLVGDYVVPLPSTYALRLPLRCVRIAELRSAATFVVVMNFFVDYTLPCILRHVHWFVLPLFMLALCVQLCATCVRRHTCTALQ